MLRKVASLSPDEVNFFSVYLILSAFVTSACSFALLATALQLVVFQQQIQFVNLEIFLGTLVRVFKIQTDLFSLFLMFLVCFSCDVILLLFVFVLTL
jgi:hypothetical protein